MQSPLCGKRPRCLSEISFPKYVWMGVGGELVTFSHTPEKGIYLCSPKRLGFCTQEYCWLQLLVDLAMLCKREFGVSGWFMLSCVPNPGTPSSLTWSSCCSPFWLLDPLGFSFYCCHSLRWYLAVLWWLLDFPLTHFIGNHNMTQGKSY